MSSTAKVLVPKTNLGTTTAAIYTSPVNGKGTWVDSCDFVNYLTGSHTVTVWIVPSGGTLADVHKHLVDKTVAAKTTLVAAELMGRFLAPGSTVHAVSSVANEISVYMTGRELS